MGYQLNTSKTWRQTYDQLTDVFNRWTRHLGRRVNWDVENLRGKREVTLRYQLPDQSEVTLTMAQQRTAEDNLRVLFLAVEAMYLNDRRGVTDLVREAYLALPAPVTQRDPYEVLGVRPDSPPAVIEAAYKALAKASHPDAGGSTDAMAELNAAYEAVRA